MMRLRERQREDDDDDGGKNLLLILYLFFFLFVCLLVLKTLRKNTRNESFAFLYCFPGVVLLLLAGWGVPVKLFYTE